MDTTAFDTWNEETTMLQTKYNLFAIKPKRTTQFFPSSYTKRHAKKTRPEVNPQNKPIPFPQSNLKFPNGTLKGSYEGTTLNGTHVFKKKHDKWEKPGYVDANGARIDLRSVVGKWYYRIQGEV